MRDSFRGWYFKCQSDTQTLAVIPAVHTSGNEQTCSIQLITDEGAWNVGFPDGCFQEPKEAYIVIGENAFAPGGVRLRLHAPQLSAEGFVRFGRFSPIRYDIMGPFCYVPFMECRHSVLSMKHTVNGELCVNGKDYCFHNAVGYIEGDRGCSFPKRYAWTQCCFSGGSLMLSVADIPMGPFHFTGVIGVVQWHGKEYRLATYLGAKALKIQEGEIIIRQGDVVLAAKLMEKRTHPLHAPSGGAMTRTIHESAACRVFYRFMIHARTVFSFETTRASFEYEYPD